MCYDQIPEKLNPYDHDTFEKYQGNFYSVVTNIETGEAEYIPIKDLRVDIEAIRASASLPLVSRNVPIGGKLYLDGGISDAIPLRRSIVDGNRKNIVVMTKEAKNRHIAYNETLDFMEEQIKAGNTFLIQPKVKSDVNSFLRNCENCFSIMRSGA